MLAALNVKLTFPYDMDTIALHIIYVLKIFR